MDKEMSEREAFDEHWDRNEGGGSPFVICWRTWQAACKWQRERDAEICRQLNLVSDAAWVEGTLDCAAAILNQTNTSECSGGKE